MSDEVKKPQTFSKVGINIHTRNLELTPEDDAKLKSLFTESIVRGIESDDTFANTIAKQTKKQIAKERKLKKIAEKDIVPYVEPWKQARDQLEKAMNVLELEYSRVAANALYKSFSLLLNSKIDELQGLTENPFFLEDAFQELVKGFGLDSFFGAQLVPDEVTGQELEQYRKFFQSIPDDWPFLEDDEIGEDAFVPFSPRKHGK